MDVETFCYLVSVSEPFDLLKGFEDIYSQLRKVKQEKEINEFIKINNPLKEPNERISFWHENDEFIFKVSIGVTPIISPDNFIKIDAYWV